MEHACNEVDSSQLYNLATSILEECKQATPNLDIDTVVHLLNWVLGLHLVPDLLPNSLIRLAEMLCRKQNESSDEAHPNQSTSPNSLAVLLTMRFQQSGECGDLDEAISLHRDALELLPAGHPN